MSDGYQIRALSNAVSYNTLFAPSFFRPMNDIVQHAHREYWLSGGRGSGKSSFVSLAIVMLMMFDAWNYTHGKLSREQLSHAIAYRKVGTDVKDSVLFQVEWAINKLGVARYWHIAHNQHRATFLPTGQMIRFRGLDDAIKQKSMKAPFGFYKYLWFEETTQFDSMKELRSVRQSVIRGGSGSITFCTYNPPPSLSNWVNDEAAKPIDGRVVYKSDYRRVPKDWLGEDFIADALALKASSPEAYNHEYLGIITGTGKEIFKNLQARRITDDEIAQFRSVRIGLDFGYENDPTALMFCNYDAKHETVYIYDEWVKHGQFEEQIYEQIKQRKAENKVIVADCAESREIGRLNMLGARRVIKCYKAAGYVDSSLRWLRNPRRRIVIDPLRCPIAWDEFRHYEFEMMRDGTPRDEYPDKNNHTIDAIRYALENEIRFGNAARLVV